MKFLLIFLSFILAANCSEGYKNYKLYDVVPNETQYDALAAWEYIDGVDFFRLTSPNRSSKVLIAPKIQNDFESFLTRNNIVYSILSEDFDVEIEKERESMVETRKIKTGYSIEGTADFSVYWSFAEMDRYLQDLAARYPHRITLENLIFSPEGRHVWAVKISSGVFGQKPIIGMETGMHAREWAAPPTSFYLIDKLVTDEAIAAELLARVDWLIVPMQNPDGYEWSRTPNNRLWRQNRRQITPTCTGADLNRNFAYSWRAATVACGSLTYPGPFALSEPEDFVLHEVMERYRQNLRMYLSVHTFGDLVLFPWGYSDNPGPLPLNNVEEHIHVGNIFRDAILAATGKDYFVVNSLNYFGNINGAVDDNMLAAVGADLAYTLELTDGFSFLYPEDRILALSEETFVGYRALGRYIGETYG